MAAADRAEGGQVEPVLGRFIEFAPFLSWAKSVSLHEEQEDAHQNSQENDAHKHASRNN